LEAAGAEAGADADGGSNHQRSGPIPPKLDPVSALYGSAFFDAVIERDFNPVSTARSDRHLDAGALAHRTLVHARRAGAEPRSSGNFGLAFRVILDWMESLGMIEGPTHKRFI
jgi:hypothetical protein